MNKADDPSSGSTPLVENSCPFLGLLGDRETSFGFPNYGNRCYRVTPVADIALDYQQNLCLSEHFKECRVFQNPSNDNLPEGVSLHHPRFKLSPNSLIAIIVIATLFVLVASFFLVQRVFFPNISGETGSATLTAAAVSVPEVGTNMVPSPVPFSETPSPSASPTLTPIPTSTNTPEPTMTYTPEPPTPGPGLETPFGPGSEYLLHKVQPGESARSIAFEYRTSYTVISTTNTLLPGGSVLVGDVLVIIPGIKENLGLPVFRPLYLDQDASVSAIAELYGILTDDLRRYNTLGMDGRIPAGRWIIIPLPTPTSP